MSSFRHILLAALCTAALCPLGHSQATPAATAPDPYGGFALPNIGGTLRYSLSAAETVLTGYNGSTGQGASTYTSFSGNLAYLSRSQRHPFSTVYSGGYLVGGSSFPSYFYQSLSLSQGYATKNWNFLVADSVDYAPQTSIGGLSGIPGAGDLTVSPVQITTGTGLGILTTYATRIGNVVSGSATRRLTGATSVSFSGSYGIQRYTGSSTGFQGIDNDQKLGSVGLQHRLDARSSIGGSYSYASSGFKTPLLGTGTHGFQSHSVQASYNRKLTRKLNFTVGAGPQWVPGGTGATTQATSINLAANAGLTYAAQHYNAGLTYARGVNNGNGVVVGAQTDAVTGNIARQFGRIYNVGGVVGYNRSAQLSNSVLANYNNSGVTAGGQFSAQVARPVSVFVSYTLQRQIFNGYSPAGIAFNGLTQFVSFGVTFSPKPFYDRK